MTNELRHLSRTALHVSRVCLGTMTFGKPVDQATATKMVERSIDFGINFFDTANVYQLGAAETMLGNVLHGKREKAIIASKVYGTMGDKACDHGLSKHAIFRAIEATLQRLQTDYLDIYYLHQPDYDVRIEETLLAMDLLVQQGKVRYSGFSNYSAWQVCQMMSWTDRRGWQPPIVAQPMYNLLARNIETEFLPMAKEFGIPVVTYNPLAGGMLTGKHNSTGMIPGSRFDQNEMYQDRYWHDENFDAVDRLKKVAREEGRSLVSLALNWLLHHSSADSVILGASRLEQLEEDLSVIADGPLSDGALAICEEVWRKLKGPSPNYGR